MNKSLLAIVSGTAVVIALLGGVVAQAQTAQRWEYKVALVANNSGDATSQLNTLAGEGWELVTASDKFVYVRRASK